MWQSHTTNAQDQHMLQQEHIQGMWAFCGPTSESDTYLSGIWQCLCYVFKNKQPNDTFYDEIRLTINHFRFNS